MKTSNLIALLLLVPAASCKPPSAAPVKAEIAVRAIKTQVVQTEDLVRTVEVVGTLEGEQEVRVFSQVPERIVSLPVKEGQLIRKGQVLAVLLAQMQDEGLKQAQAALETVTANRDVLLDQLKRTRALVEAGALPRSQLETMEKQLAASEAQIRQVATGLSAASVQRDRTVITAPMTGVVAQLNVREGDMALPSIPLLTVVKADSLKATFMVPEREFLNVEVGMPVDVELLGKKELRVQGRVGLKAPVVDRMTRTGRVEIHIANGEGRIPPGAAVRGRIEIERHANVVLVPARAVLLGLETDRTGMAHAFVVEGDLARKREVQIGARQGPMLEIRKGLKPGERLVVLGQHLLRDNNPVRVMDTPQPPEAARASNDLTGPATEVLR